MGIAGSKRESAAWLFNAKLSGDQLSLWEAAFTATTDSISDALYADGVVGQALVTRDGSRLNVNLGDTANEATRQYEALLEDMLWEGADATDRQLEELLRKQAERVTALVRFDIKNPRAQQWIARTAATLVTNVTNSTVLAIREAVFRSFRDGIPVLQSAQQIKPLVGLLPQHAAAVDKFFATQLANGVPMEQAQRQAERYANRLHNYRARNIARTETIRAANEGRRMLWDEAQRVGVLPTTVTRTWVAATGSPRTCPICLELDGKTAGINETFYSGELGQDVMGPPSHPSCRCTTIITEETLQRAA